MNVLFTASESHPFLKTGGLGDVAFALPKALRKLGIDARVIIPKYDAISSYYKNQMETISEFSVPVGWRNQYCGLKYLEYEDVPFYFTDNEYYLKRGGAYGFYDDGERFSYFCRAALESINHMRGFVPDIIHCNDWHSGMIPPLLNHFYKSNPRFNKIKTVFTIHNLQYQGVYPKEILDDLLGLDDRYFNEGALKYHDGVSFMKGGINYSDIITTVSESYAEEIKTPYYGESLDGLLQKRGSDLKGIVNGIDYELINPKLDANISYNYDVNCIENKQKNKIELQQSLNLPVNENIPMIGLVTRLVKQKGLDLIICVLEELLESEDIQIVLVGTGSAEYEDTFKYFARKYPNKMSSNILFDNPLAQKVYASSDMFLMPSLFEPCGIGQLIALRFGTIPIVRETGGLKDTVKAYDETNKSGNGFTFANYNAHDMLFTIRRAVTIFRRKDEWNSLIRKVMLEDNSWQRSARKYMDLYYSLS